MSIKFEKPKWATGITVTAPPSGKQLIGWIKEKPPFGYFNWLARTTYDWINNLGDASAGYTSLAEFVAEAEPGDTGIIKHGLGYVPWAELQADNMLLGDVLNIDGDGEFLVTTNLAYPSPWTLLDPDDVTISIRTFSPSSPPAVGNGKAVTNGEFVVGIWDDKVQCYNRDTGATVWTHTDPNGLGDVFRDICIVDDRVYVVGGILLTINCRSLSLVDGTLIDFYGAWAANINQVQCDGRFVYAAGPADGSGDHIIALSLDLSTKVWGYTASGPVTRLVTDGREIVAYDGTNIIRIDAMTGTGLQTHTTGPDVVALEIDSEWIYVGGPVNITRRPRGNLAVSIAMSADTTDRRAIYSDDERVFVGQEDDGATLRVYGRYNRDRIWRRLDPSGDINCPRRQAAICMGAP